jgi:hypothetical protein
VRDLGGAETQQHLVPELANITKSVTVDAERLAHSGRQPVDEVRRRVRITASVDRPGPIRRPVESAAVVVERFKEPLEGLRIVTAPLAASEAESCAAS